MAYGIDIADWLEKNNGYLLMQLEKRFPCCTGKINKLYSPIH